MNSEVDLLIVGGGPAGLLASIIAARIGLSYHILESRSGTHPEPSAHVFKTHTMEVYRRIGVADELFAKGTPVEQQQGIIWCESVTGLIYGRLDLTGKKGRVARFTEISPACSLNMPQSRVEPVLHRRLVEIAGKDPVQFGTRLEDFTQDEDGVTATVRGPDGLRQMRARYIIGADGAASQVRRSAGIAMQGPQALAHFLAIHIRSDMTDIIAERPSILFFIRTHRLDGFFIVHESVGSQVFMMRFDPETTPFEFFDEERCRAIMDEALGSARDYSISSIDRWAMSAQVADHYRNGRALLVGDAGHRFPPTGGLGLNTGVEDVENLLWKIAAVLRGQASDALLDSYEVECRPIAIRNTDQSMFNFERMGRVNRALQADQGSDAVRDLIMALQADGNHPAFAAIQQAVDDQIDHFAFLELEMAVKIRDSAAIRQADRSIALPVPAVEGYQPSFTPGGHIPHFWISPDTSSLDLLSFDTMTLFAPIGDMAAWRAAVSALPSHLMPVNIVAIEGEMRSVRARVADYWGDYPYAILVRPDGRIAWVEPETMHDRGIALAAAVSAITQSPNSQNKEMVA